MCQHPSFATIAVGSPTTQVFYQLERTETSHLSWSTNMQSESYERKDFALVAILQHSWNLSASLGAWTSTRQSANDTDSSIMSNSLISRVHFSRLKDPLVRTSAICLVVSAHSIWIIGSRLILSYNQSSATRWVRERVSRSDPCF